MAEPSRRLSIISRPRLVGRYITQPRFLLAFLYFGTALLFETTSIQNSNVAQQFTRIGAIRDVAHVMSVYFMTVGNLVVLPVIFERMPDILKRWYGVIIAISPIGCYVAFAVLTALYTGTLLPIWWVAWVGILFSVIFARGWQ